MTQSVLVLDQVGKRFDRTQVLQDVSLELHDGERLALIGPNGAGKSTLFNLISGRTPLDAGDIRLHGQSIRKCSPPQIHRLGLSRSFQISQLFPKLSVYENLCCASLSVGDHGYVFWRRLSGLSDVARRAEELLDIIGLSARRNVLAGELSYAEQRALEIGITIAGNAQVLLLDEPTAGMSRSESAATIALIRDVSKGKSLLMIEHDMSVVFELADRIAVLVNGRLIACDTPDRIRAHPEVQKAYLGTLAEEWETLP